MDFTIYLDKENIYSINNLIKYINRKKVKAKKFPLSKFDADLYYKSYIPKNKNKKKYSILDVINNPKKYEYDYKRMMDSELKYPIIALLIDHDPSIDFYIIDGLHRLGKHHLKKRKTISAYVISKKTLNKFIIGKRNKRGWEMVKKLRKLYNK